MLETGFHGNRFFDGDLCAAAMRGEKEAGLDRRDVELLAPAGDAGMSDGLRGLRLRQGGGPLYPLHPPRKGLYITLDIGESLCLVRSMPREDLS